MSDRRPLTEPPAWYFNVLAVLFALALGTLLVCIALLLWSHGAWFAPLLYVYLFPGVAFTLWLLGPEVIPCWTRAWRKGEGR